MTKKTDNPTHSNPPPGPFPGTPPFPAKGANAFVPPFLTIPLPTSVAPQSPLAPNDRDEQTRSSLTRYNTKGAAHWIACAIQLPVEAGPVSAACCELLHDFGLMCESLGLPVTPTHNNRRGVIKLSIPMFGSILDIVSTGMTIGIRFTYAGERNFMPLALTYDSTHCTLVGPDGIDAAEVVAAKVFFIASHLVESSTTIHVPPPLVAKPSA